MQALGHFLRPVVRIGNNGLSDGCFNELIRALNDHELIKIKINAPKEKRLSLTKLICTRTDCYHVSSTGLTALLFKPSLSPKTKTSNLVKPY